MGNNNSSDYERKTYRLFILIFIILISFIIFGSTILSDYLSDYIVLKLIFIFCSLVLILLSYIIYIKERIYWISSYSYKKACSMSSDERKHIAMRFFMVFRTTFVLIILYMLIGMILKSSVIIDMIVFIIGTISAAIMTSFTQPLRKNNDSK